MRISLDGIEPGTQGLRLTFDGREVMAEQGDTIASALVNAGFRGYRIAGKGDERGVFCGMGVCHECAVVVDENPGHLACMTPATQGASVGRQPPKAGLVAAESPEMPEQILEPDVLVIGGGPAGIASAHSAAMSGLDVLVVDERAKLGGQYFKQPSGPNLVHEDKVDDQFSAGRKLIRAAKAAGVEVLLNVRVWGASSQNHLFAAGPRDRYVIRPKAIVLATGAYERGVPLPGWTLPGVMTTGAAQSLLRSHRVAPGERVLVSGNGPLNLQLAADMACAGVEVVALAEVADVRWWNGLASGVNMATASPSIVARGMRYRAALLRKRVPVLARTAVISVQGDGVAQTAVVAKLDAEGKAISGTEQAYEVDAVCVGFGFLPSNEISRALGCVHSYNPESGELTVERSRTGRTSIDRVWVVGDSGGIAGAQVALSAGVLAGCDIVEELGKRIHESVDRSKAEKQLRRHRRFQTHLWRLYRSPILTTQLAGPTTVVCRCESVTLAELKAAADAGAATAGAIKRVTRAGMGRCQGRYCGPVVTNVAAEKAGAPIDAFSGFAPQAPFGPTDISAIASPRHGGDV